jgi:hypothetical protein
MKRSWRRAVLAAAVLFACVHAVTAEAGGWIARRYAQQYSWHHDYYDPAWAPQPHALVVPPTTHRHVEYNWGVAGTENLPIRHQFNRGYYGEVYGGGAFAPTPPQPTSTHQFGVYYIRAPW